MIFLAIPVGFLQEPLRKIASGQPVSFQLAVVVVFTIGMLAAISRFGMPNLRPLTGTSKHTRALLSFFVALVFVQAVHSLMRFGTPMVPLIGLLSYLLPIPALWVAYQFARTSQDIRQLLLLYVIIGAVMISGVFASYYGINSEIFKQIGDSPMVVYHHEVGVVELYCGFLRTPEVAAWHSAAIGCLAAVLAMTFRKPIYTALAPIIFSTAFFSVVLTGRRKALAIMVLFVFVYLGGLLMARRRSSKVAALVTITVAALIVGAVLLMAPENSAPSPHLDRSATAFGDAWDRFEQLGINTIAWGYNAGGILGLGTGAGAQGTQHVAGMRALGAAEGGLGRITVELGPLGLILCIACAVAVAKQVRRCIGAASHHSSELLRLELGLIAFVAANVPVFIGAAQIFGDPFILLLLGLLLGFVLAAPRIIRNAELRAQRKGLNRDHFPSLDVAAKGLSRRD